MKTQALRWPSVVVHLACVLALLALVQSTHALDLYVAPNGDDSAQGTQSAPLRTLEGARNRVRSLSKDQSIRVLFRAGTYRFTEGVTFGPNDSGQNNRAIVYQSAPGETAFFDGGKVIPRILFRKVSGSETDRLARSARGNVWAADITDPTTRRLLSNARNGVNINGNLFRPAENPNNSYYNISREFSSGSFLIHESEDFPLLQRELNRNNTQAEVFGYVRREFAAYTLPISKFSGGGNSVIELKGSDGSLGFPGRKGDIDAAPRMKIRNMLGVVDTAREWFFDRKLNRLYIFPQGGNLSNDAEIVVWGGERAINCQNVKNVYFHNFVIQNFAPADTQVSRFRSVVEFQGCDNVRLRGSTLRRIAVPLAPFSIEGRSTNCLVDSCDIYDNGRGSRLRGGGIRTGSVTTGNNRVSNCHFTRVDLYTSLGTAIGIEGRGNIFSQNLVHNTSRQSIVYQGYDHKIELNEIYNVNQDEGDGGAIYTGANLQAHGTVLRRNLIHHNIGIPGLIPRAGIYFDDFGAGNTAIENILFKGGAFGIYSNRGTANTLQRNIVIRSFSGARSGGGGKRPHDIAMSYLNRENGRTPDQRIKENYVGNMLRICGKPGWQTRVNANNWRSEIEPFWTDRYPRFGFSMDKYFAQKVMIPFETRIYDNYFAECDENVQAPPGSNARNNRNFNLSQMVNASGALDFRWRSSQRPAGSINTSDFNPGLSPGTFRRSVPDRADYRSKVSRFFNGVPSFEPDARYDRSKVNRNRYNSGRDVIGSSQSGLSVREGDAAKNSSLSTPPSPRPPAPRPPTTTPPGSGDTGSFVDRSRYLWDFGTASSPVFQGATRITENTTRGFARWLDNSRLNSRDRGAGNNLNRDFVQGSVTRIFRQQIRNGRYQVRMNLYDPNFVHDAMYVKVEGQDRVLNLRSGRQFSNVTQDFQVEIRDGTIDFEFSDRGGNDANWVVNRIQIDRLSSAPTPAKEVIQLDLGTANSPVQSGYQSISPNNRSGRFRWNNPVSARDRGEARNVNTLNRDFIFSDTFRIFTIDQITNGTWDVEVTLGDRFNRHDQQRVRVGDVIIFDSQTTEAGQFLSSRKRVNVSNGRIDIFFNDFGGQDANWCCTRIRLFQQ